MSEAIKEDPTTDPVLRLYQKVNPSVTLIEDPDRGKQHAERLTKRFVHQYRLPIRLFRGATVLDVGCGTGEKSLVFASWGAKVIGVDYNEEALERAEYLASISQYRANLAFHLATLPDLPDEIDGKGFDFVYADGVLHHTAEPLRCLHRIAERVAEGGWLIVRNYQTITSVQRLLKRLIVRLGAGDDEDQIVANTMRLFAEDIERSVGNGGRMPEQPLYDNFVNPRYKPFDSRVPFQVCEKFGFIPYAFVPNSDASIFLGPEGASEIKDDSLKEAWRSAVLGRAAVASETASFILERERMNLDHCHKSAQELEEAVKRLINEPSAADWDGVHGAIRNYLEAIRSTLASFCRRQDQHLTTFLKELGMVEPVVRECIDKDKTVSELPETSVLFRGMSGFPMASWVLWRPEPTPLPLNLA